MAERLESLRFYREAFVVQFKTALAVELQYRAAEVIWLLFFVLKPLMFLSVWTAVARAARDTGGYAPADLVAYFLITMWVVHLTFNGVLVFFEGRVRRGDFSPLLLRPIYPIAGDLAANLAYKALTIPLMTVATAVLFATFQPRLETPRWAVAAFVPALLLALVVRFVITWMVGLAAFWLTRTQAVTQLFLFLLLFLGGEAAPLTLLPGWVQVVPWRSPPRCSRSLAGSGIAACVTTRELRHRPSEK